jgi:hypothetical protein
MVEGSMDDEGVLEAGRAIRPYLERLLGPAAPEFDARLAGLLVRASAGEQVGSAVRELLEEDETTADFLSEVLADAPHYRPPYVQPGYLTTREISPLPGEIVEPVRHAGRFECPGGDFVWYRPAVGTPIPPCPTHGPGLVRT